MSSAIPDLLPATVLGEASERYDVVVVGFGIAGGCAALEAARAGARVLLLERAAVHGGTSAMSGGHFYLGGGTAVQQATGWADSADEMYEYLVAVSKQPEHDKIRAYCDGSVEHFDWLESLGFEFERSYYPEKAVIQPGTEGLMFTGNEKVWPFKERAVPAPRGHKVPVPGDTEGTKMVMDLLRRGSRRPGSRSGTRPGRRSSSSRRPAPWSGSRGGRSTPAASSARARSWSPPAGS
jgi:phytoene dehydrogenase-like protein